MERWALFNEVKEKVEAYRAFLEEQGFQGGDWEEIPITDKESYLLRYPMTQLFRRGEEAKCSLIGASSGFSKKGSVFWLKRAEDEESYLKAVEEVLKDAYGIDKKPTLIMVSLAFGTWIGGMQLACTFRSLAARTPYHLTAATPGLDLEEAAYILEEFGSMFQQVLWVTNASNVNIIYSLLQRKGYPLKGTIYFPVVGEYYPEIQREETAEKFGHPREEPFAMWTGYGSADTGDLGMETRETILIRKFLARHPHICQELFETDEAPMIMSKNPKAFIETINGELVVTKDQFIPLIRYNTKDLGGVVTRERLEKAGVPGRLLEKAPQEMLYVMGRVEDAVVFYGTNLKIPQISQFLFSLPKEMEYGGLFEVTVKKEKGVDLFVFTIYTLTGDKSLEDAYRDRLIDFLKGYSREFNAKYDRLTAAAGEHLIKVEIKDIASQKGMKKHRYLKEE